MPIKSMAVPDATHLERGGNTARITLGRKTWQRTTMKTTDTICNTVTLELTLGWTRMVMTMLWAQNVSIPSGMTGFALTPL